MTQLDKPLQTLSPIQQLIYQTIQQNRQSQSAYQLLDKVKNTIPNAKPMMIYRALAFLENQGLIHKIKSTATYHSCKDAVHQGEALFLICQLCGTVEELELEPPIFNALHGIANTRGFQFSNKICEISGFCHSCQ